MDVYGVRTGGKAGDAMTRNLVSISDKSTIKQAAKLMAKEGIGCLVVQKDDDVIGIITDTDIVRKAVTSNVSTAKRLVRSVMSSDLVTIDAGEDIFEATRMMRDYNIKHLFVSVDKDIVGLITLKDIMKIEPDLFEILVEKIELRESERKPLRR